MNLSQEQIKKGVLAALRPIIHAEVGAELERRKDEILALMAGQKRRRGFLHKIIKKDRGNESAE